MLIQRQISHTVATRIDPSFVGKLIIAASPQAARTEFSCQRLFLPRCDAETLQAYFCEGYTVLRIVRRAGWNLL
jgi:hypothetical protein